MSYITVAGDVSDPTGLAEPNCLIKFVADVSYNKTLKNSVSIIPVASDGSYSTQLSKGAFLVGIDYSGKGSFSPIGRFVIDDNTASPITLADLLNDGKLTTSLSTAELDRLSNSVRSAIESENAAATSATAAQASATGAANNAEDSADSATDSANSATQSAASAASAQTSKEASANSATESSYSAADSANSATAAAASEASAMSSACTAATSATRAAENLDEAVVEVISKAADSATDAANRATDAADSATDAADSATDSANSATQAANSATAAAASAAEAAEFEGRHAVLIVPSNYVRIGDEPATVITDPNLPNAIVLDSQYVLNNPFGEMCDTKAETLVDGKWLDVGLSLSEDISSGYSVEAKTQSSLDVPDIVVITKSYSVNAGGFNVTFAGGNKTTACRVWCYPVKLKSGGVS